MSKQLAFPTGKSIDDSEVVENFKESTLYQVLSILRLNPVLIPLPIKERRNNKVVSGWKWDANFNSYKDVETLNRILSMSKFYRCKFKDDNKILLSVLRELFGDDKLKQHDLESLENALAKFIDRHNNYVYTKIFQRNEEDIQKNFAVSQIFDIIQDPINQRQALSSVDVVTDPIKDLAKRSDKVKDLETATPGNFFNKIVTLIENSVGKLCIGISAVGSKVLDAIDSAVLYMLYYGYDLDVVDVIITPTFVDGLKFYGKANTKVKDLNREFSEGLKEYLASEYASDDVKLVNSALLGLSADNAKELVLSKINADKTTLSLYLYGISIGMDIILLEKIINSPMMNRISILCKGNLFDNNRGFSTISDVLKYLDNKYPYSMMSAVDGFEDHEYFVNNNISFGVSNLCTLVLLGKEFMNNFGLSIDDGLTDWFSNLATKLNKFSDADLDDFIDLMLERAICIMQNYLSLNEKSIFSDPIYKYPISLAHQAMNNFFVTLRDMTMWNKCKRLKSSIYGNSSLAKDIKNLTAGAEDYSMLGQICGINQGVKTNDKELLDLLNRIQDAFKLKASIQYEVSKDLKISGKEIGIKFFKDVLLKELHGKIPEDMYLMLQNDNTPVMQLAEFSEYVNELEAARLVKQMLFGKGCKEMDLREFLLNPVYLKWIIRLYNQMAPHSYNIFAVIASAKNYTGYIEMLSLADLALEQNTQKYSMLKNYIPFIEKTFGYFDSKGKKQLTKNLNNSIDRAILNKWLLRFLFEIPASTQENPTYMVTPRMTLKKNTTERIIQLGTERGNDDFKIYVEKTLIPALKRNSINNAFVAGLKPTVNNRTISGVENFIQSIPNVNMMQQDTDGFLDIKDGFNKLYLTNINVYPIIDNGEERMLNVQDMLYLYNMIVSGKRVSPIYLTNIFNDYNVRPNSLDTSFRTFESETHLTDDELTLISTSYEILPFSSPYQKGSSMIRYVMPHSGDVVLLLRGKGEPDEMGEVPMQIGNYYVLLILAEKLKSYLASGSVENREVIRENGTILIPIANSPTPMTVDIFKKGSKTLVEIHSPYKGFTSNKTLSRLNKCVNSYLNMDFSMFFDEKDYVRTLNTLKLQDFISAAVDALIINKCI